MGLLDIEKKSESLVNQTAADSEGANVTGLQGQVVRDDGIAFGGQFNTTKLADDLSGGDAIKNYNGVALGGEKNNNVLGGVNLGGNNSGNIVINDATETTKAVETAVSAIKDSNDSTAETVRYLAGAALDKTTQLAETKQTEGTLPLAKVFGWVAAGLFLAWALVAMSKPRSS